MGWYQRHLKPTYGAHFQLFPSWLLRDRHCVVWNNPEQLFDIAHERHSRSIPELNQGRQRALSSHDVTKTLVQFESGVSGCVDCATPECGAILELARKRSIPRPSRRAHSDVLDSATVPSDSSLIGQAIVHWGLQEQILTMETGKACFLTLWITTFSVHETRSQVYLEPLEPGLLRTS